MLTIMAMYQNLMLFHDIKNASPEQNKIFGKAPSFQAHDCNCSAFKQLK